MARLSKVESEIKQKAILEILEEIDILIEANLPPTNPFTYRNICSLANSSAYGEEFKTRISISSLKQPTSDEFKKIKKLIDAKKEEYKRIKNLTSYKSKNKINSLEKKIDSLMEIIIELSDKLLILEKKLSYKDISLEKAKKERDRYQHELDNRERNDNRL